MLQFLNIADGQARQIGPSFSLKFYLGLAGVVLLYVVASSLELNL